MTRSYGLTQRQHDVLVFVRGFIAERGHSPSYSEIADFLGLRSKSGVHRLIEGLVERGHIVRTPCLARSLALPMDFVPAEAAIAATLRRYVELSGPITINDCPAAAAHLARTVPAIPRASA